MRIFIVFLITFSFLVHAQRLDQTALFERVLTGQSQAEDFSEEFLENVPFSQIPMLLAQIEQQFGAFESISANEDAESFTVTFEKVIATGILPLNAAGKIAGFRFVEVEPRESPTEANATEASDDTEPLSLMLDTIFSERISAADFTPEFLAQVPFAQMQTILAEVQSDIGDYQQSSLEGANFSAEFTQGTVKGQIALNAAGQIQGLLFTEVLPHELSLEDGLETLAAMLDEAALAHLLVLHYQGDNVEMVLEHNPQQELAVGSAFKMAVLSTLQQQIAAGTHQWHDVVSLEESDISYPSGILQDWAADTPLTLQSLANLMISISDNTATDTLMRVVGREAIEAHLADMGIVLEQPFMTTKEMFQLKLSDDDISAIRAQYLAADKSEKLALLEEAAQRPRIDLRYVTARLAEPRFLEAEWYFSAPELCQLMQAVENLPAMSIHAGVVNADDWQHVAYKGGSETGVMNLTTWLEDGAGSSYCIVTTVNNPAQALNENSIAMLHQKLALALR